MNCAGELLVKDYRGSYIQCTRFIFCIINCLSVSAVSLRQWSTCGCVYLHVYDRMEKENRINGGPLCVNGSVFEVTPTSLLTQRGVTLSLEFNYGRHQFDFQLNKL